MTQDESLTPWLLVNHLTLERAPTPEPDYRPKLFNDPRNPDSSKENVLPLEPVPMAIFNVSYQCSFKSDIFNSQPSSKFKQMYASCYPV